MAPCGPRARFSLPQDRGLTGKLEPVSPASPPRAEPDLELLPPRLSKEELIQSMDRVDREITMVEQQISKLKRKQVRRAPGWRLCAPGAAARAGAEALDAGRALGSARGPASLRASTFVARGAVLCVRRCPVGLCVSKEAFSGCPVAATVRLPQLGTEPFTLIRMQGDGHLN